MKYSLINPSIKGEFNNTIKASSVMEAAQKFWDGMSRYFTNNLEKFPYTVMNEKGELSHFIAKEKVSGNNVEYTIKKLKMDVSSDKEEKLKNVFKQSQSGGKKHKKNKKEGDDSSSSSSSSSYHVYHHTASIYPITYWDYYPTIYSAIDVVSVPTWVTPLSPIMNVWLW